MSQTTDLQCIAEDDTSHYPAAAKVACASAAAEIERLTAENESLRAALAEASRFIKDHDGARFFDRLGAVYKIDSLVQQLSVNSEEGK